MKLKIENIRSRAVMVPLKRPPVSASGALPEAALVLVDIETGEGITGHSYLAAYGKAMLKPLVSTTEWLVAKPGSAGIPAGAWV